jgi:biotin carboxylase
MMHSPPTRKRPLLAVAHGYRSIPPIQLAAAAADQCDLLWLVDGRDPEIVAVGKLLKRFGTMLDIGQMAPDEAARAVRAYRPDGILAFRDDDLISLSLLAEALDLPFHRPIVAQRLADKLYQREALRVGGLPVPRYWDLPSRQDQDRVQIVAGEVSYPAIVKPRQASGSWHTFRVNDAVELTALLARLAEQGNDDEAMIVEEYLPSTDTALRQPFADYVSVESLVSDGRISHVATTGRLHPAEPFRETGFFIPADLGSDAAAVLAMATAALEALEVRTGCVHTEIKLTPDGPRVIEVNGRLGGGVPDMLGLCSDIDLLGLSLRLALGEHIEVDGPVHCDNVGFRLFYQPPVSASRLLSITGLSQVGSLPGVTSVSTHASPDKPINSDDGTRSYIFSLVGSAPDYDGVLHINRQVYNAVDVSYVHDKRSHRGVA